MNSLAAGRRRCDSGWPWLDNRDRAGAYRAEVGRRGREDRDDGAGSWGVVLIVAAASGVAQGFGRFSFPALLPAMKRDLIGSYGGAGFLGTANVAAYLVGAVAVMVVSLRRPVAHILAVGTVLSTVAMLILALAPGLGALAFGMALAGIGGAAVFVSAPAIARAVVPPARIGLAIGVVTGGVGVGMVIGGQLARWSSHWWGPSGWRWVWVIQAGIAAGVAVLAWIGVRHVRTGGVGRPRLSALRAVPGWRAHSLAYLLFGFGYIVFITYIAAAVQDDGGFASGHAANDYAILGVGAMVGGVALGRLSDHIGRRGALVVGYAGAAACPLQLLTYAEPWVAVAVGAFGVLFAGIVTVVAAYLADRSPPREFPAAFAAVTVAFGLAQALGPQVGGWLADVTDRFTLTMLAAAVTLGAAAAIALTLPSQPSPRQAEANPPTAAPAGAGPAQLSMRARRRT